MGKKFWKFLIIFIVLCCSIRIDAKAADEYLENYTYYTLSDYSVNGTYTLTFGLNHKKKIAAVTGFKIGEGFDGHVELPAEVKFATDGVTEDTYTVVGIKRNAFTENKDLQSIKFPDTVNFVAPYSFYKCSALKTVEFGAELWQLDEHCFGFCKSLTEIDLSKTKLYTINQSAFSACYELSKVTFPDTLQCFGNECFDACNKLCEIELPKETNFLGARFISGTSITSLVIPKTIGENRATEALEGAKQLKTVTLEDGITFVPEGLFQDTESLETINIPNTVTKICKNAFHSSNIPNNLVLPDTITYIGEAAFKDVVLPTGFKLPDSVTTLASYAFQSSKFLSTLELPKNLTNIAYRAFRGAILYNIKLELPFTLKIIGQEAFSGCDVLEIIINSDLENAEYAFDNYWNDTARIEKVIFSENVTSIPYRILMNSEIKEVVIPNTVTTINADAFAKSTITEINLSENLTYLGTGVFEGSSLKNIVVPNSIKIIKNGTFASCINLDSVTIGNEVTTIEQEAFQGSSIEKFVMPDSVVTVGKNAFSDCNYLKELVLSAYLDGDSLKNILCATNTGSLKNLEIPYGFTYLENNIKIWDTLYIPESVSSIDTTFSKTAVGKIVGVKGSYAENFALENEIPFEEGVDAIDFTILNRVETLTVGEEVLVEISTTPRNIKNNVSWHSSDDTVVSVSKTGDLKALKAGNTTITVTIGNLARSFDVKVLKPIEEIYVSSAYLRVVGQKMKLNVWYYPADAEEEYYFMYYPSDDIYTLNDQGIVIATGLGTKQKAIEVHIKGTNTLTAKTPVHIFGNIGVPILVLDADASNNTQALAWAKNAEDWQNDYGHEGVEIFRYDREKDDWSLFTDVATGKTSFSLQNGNEIAENLNEGENVFKARYYIFDKDDNRIYGEFSEEVSYNYGKDENEPPTDNPEEDNPEAPSEEDLFKAKKVTAKLDKDSNGYSLVWNNVDADGYEIYVANSAGSPKLWVTIKNSFRNYLPKTLAPEKYTYIVKGYKIFDSQKVYCTQSSNIKYTVKLATVKSLKQKTTFTNKIEMTWGKITGATGYEIWRAQTKNSKYTKVTTVSGTSGKQYVTGGSAYYYKVRAYKKLADGSVMHGAYSAPTKLYSKPSTTTIKVTKVGSTKVKVTWTKSVGANNYDIYMSTSKSGTYKLLKTRKSTHSKYYTFTNLTKGKTYYFKVRTYKVDGSGNKIYSNWSTVKYIKLNK